MKKVQKNLAPIRKLRGLFSPPEDKTKQKIHNMQSSQKEKNNEVGSRSQKYWREKSRETVKPKFDA